MLLIWIVLIAFLLFWFFTKKDISSAFGRSFMAAILVYGFLNFFFYPSLLKYQSGSEAALYINNLKPTAKSGMFREDSYSFAFYSKVPVHYWNEQKLKMIHEPVLIFTRRANLDSLSKNGFQTKILHEFEHFHISQLTGTFINAKTRSAVTEDYVVAEVSPDKATPSSPSICIDNIPASIIVVRKKI
jgi:hypothetical protein